MNRSAFQSGAVLAALWNVLCFSALPTAHADTLRTVALTGQQSPGTPAGTSFSTFGLPAINDHGQTAFWAEGGMDAEFAPGIWSEGSGELALVAMAGTQAPGTPDGVVFSDFGDPVLNNVGQAAFSAGLAGNDVEFTNDQGIWSEGAGSLALVARNGSPAPGAPDGVVFNGLFSPVFNNAGQTAFRAWVDHTNNQGIWIDSPGALSAVVRDGSHPPGAPAGATIDFLFGRGVLNDAGHVAFLAVLTGEGIDFTNNTGIWLGDGTNLSPVILAGTAAPGVPSGITFSGLGEPALNNAGQVAFYGYLDGEDVDFPNDRGIWSEGSGSLALVARGGSPAPGTPSGVVFSEFADPLLNNAGQTAFLADLEGDDIDFNNVVGIWLERSGNLELVARGGSQAPGTPEGVHFGRLFGPQPFTPPVFFQPTLNDAGQIAFMAQLSGDGVDVINAFGIWATDRSGQLQLIVRGGDTLEVAPGDFRTISTFEFIPGLFGSDKQRSGFNNLGQIAFLATFTDGSEGIFVSNLVAVPEPCTLTLLAAAVIAALFVRCRLASNRRILAVGLIAGWSVISPHAHGDTLRTVSLTGQQAPGTAEGVTYGGFSSPVLNDTGQTAFAASLSGIGVSSTNNQGIWSEGSGSLTLVARSGNPAAGTSPGVSFSGFGGPLLNNSGQTAFLASLAGSGVTSNNNEGIWSEATGSLALLARAGSQAVGTPSGTTYVYLSHPVLSNAGQTAFSAALNSGSGVNLADMGVWSGRADSLRLVARSGGPAPGLPTGTRFGIVGAGVGFLPGLNDAGQTAFPATLMDAGQNPLGDSIWSEVSGTLALVARSGDQAPGLPDGVQFTEVSLYPAWNNAGQTAFWAGMSEPPSWAIWSEGTGSLTPVVLASDQVSSISSLSVFINNAGQTALWAEIVPGLRRSIWLEDSGSFTLIALEGDHAPGTPSGASFILNFSSLVLNDAGQIAFYSAVNNPGGDFEGIWATDQNGVLQPVALTGQPLEVAPGEFRTISDLSFGSWYGTGNGDGRPSALNNLGELVFWARFTDGSEGVFVSNLVATFAENLFGDYNGNGTVEQADLDLVLLNWGADAITPPADWINDLPSGLVDQDELDRVLLNWGRTLGTTTTPASIPEPASVVLCVLLACALGTPHTFRRVDSDVRG